MLNGRNFPVLVYKSEIWVERWCLGGALGGWLGRGWGEGTQRPDTHMACYSRTLQSSSIPRVGIFTETLYNQEVEVLEIHR